MPAALATAAVHHHLIRQGLRMQTGLVVETGEAREVHHFCVLAGYGAEAINPYLAFETLEQIRVRARACRSSPMKCRRTTSRRWARAILKVMSKMGISTYQSYCGAQIFDAVGLSTEFIEKYFTGTATTIEGIGLKEIAEESVRRHRDAYGDNPIYRNMLDVGGDYAFRLRGEDHAWTPESVSRLQHAVRGNNPAEYQLFAKHDQRTERAAAHPARADGVQDRRRRAAGRGRAGGRDRQALLHRGDELRLDHAARRTPISPSP